MYVCIQDKGGGVRGKKELGLCTYVLKIIPGGVRTKEEGSEAGGNWVPIWEPKSFQKRFKIGPLYRIEIDAKLVPYVDSI